MTSADPVAISAFHHKHVELGATMSESDGWQRPAWYGPIDDEIEGTRRAVGLCDISPLGKLRIQGDDAGKLLHASLVGFEGLASGRVQQTKLEQRSESYALLVAGLAADDALILTAPAHAEVASEALGQGTTECAHLVDISSTLAGLKVIGPLAAQLLSRLTELDLSPTVFPDMSCAQGMVAEIHGTIVRRDTVELPGYELYFAREFGEYLWDALIEAGDDLGVTPFGTEALARL